MSNPITYPGLVRVCIKSGVALLEENTPLKAHLNHMLIGITGEVGELIEAVLDNGFENQIEEFGDLEFYLEGLRVSLDINRNETIGHLNPDPQDVKDILLELTKASSNVVDAVKQHTIYNKPNERGRVVASLGQLEYWLAGLRLKLGIDRYLTLEGNIKKLSNRYAKLTGEVGYSDAAAIARADKDQEKN